MAKTTKRKAAGKNGVKEKTVARLKQAMTFVFKAMQAIKSVIAITCLVLLELKFVKHRKKSTNAT